MVYNFTGNVFDSGAPAVAHQCNALGIMGAGVALQVKQRFPSAYNAYRSLCKRSEADALMGHIQPCLCGGSKERWIINCFAQRAIGTDTKQTDYQALESCFREIHDWAIQNHIRKVAIPHGIGCGLAGGDWDTVLGILKNVFNDYKVDIEIWKMDQNHRRFERRR